METHRTYLGLGTNLGDRSQHLSHALQALQQQVGTCLHQSSVYVSAPWGLSDQPDFYNQVALFATSLSPEDLLQVILRIEKEMGRVRETKWGQRLIDIDILFYDDLIINRPNLTIPHPFIHERNFVLIPLLELAAGYQHPVLQRSIASLAQLSKDPLPVQPLPDTMLPERR
ncbi:MAG: 2-amino-4-hydroxy-6-hydroxymethyldihydropteridine diphosphokinase [Haliscomenobacter sp.]